MSLSKILGCLVGFLALSIFALPVLPQAARGKAELGASSGTIIAEYGRPQLKGRDPLTWQKEGTYWRMGADDMTTITTPVDLVFGKTRLSKGTYGMWLLKAAADRYELVFNKETSGMGMVHDKTKDVLGVPMRKESAPGPVELYTMELKNAPKGGTLVMSWGTMRLAVDFQFGN